MPGQANLPDSSDRAARGRASLLSALPALAEGSIAEADHPQGAWRAEAERARRAALSARGG